MALTDFWQVKDNQAMDGKAVLNIYHVKRILAGANALMVAQAFRDFFVDGVLDLLQPAGISRTTIEVENLGDATDFATVDSSPFPGTIVGNELASFNSATVQFNRTRNDMKNGQKRWVAGTELEQANGEWVAGFVTVLQAAGQILTLPWETDAAPGVDVCDFVILKRFCVVPEEDPCTQYRLPNTDAEADDWHYLPGSVTTRIRVRSQVSRKVLI